MNNIREVISLMKNRRVYRFLISILIVVLVLSACGRRPQRPENPTQQPKKPPGELETLTETLESIVGSLEGIIGEHKKPMIEKMREEEERIKKEEEERAQQQQGGGGQQGGGQGAGEGGAQETFNPYQEPRAIEEKITKMWEETNGQIKELHTQWNEYRPMAVKDGAPEFAVKSFQSDINKAAVEGEKKKPEVTLEHINNATKYIADFKELYKTNPPPDIERLKYFVREAHLKAVKDGWEEAKKNADQAKSAWDRAKTRVKKDDMDKATRLDLSIADFIQAVESEEANLVKIKMDIIMQNIEDMEQSFE